MAQQINLLTPILLAPKRVFSALTLLQATGLMLLVGVVVALWLQWQDRHAEALHQTMLTQLTVERQSLVAAQSSLPAPVDGAVMQQQLQAIEAGNVDRRLLLQTLGSDNVRTGHHAELLALVARTLPDSVWLNELRYAPGRLELVGGTLNTAVLRPWLGQLAANPLLQGQDLAALRVERPGVPGTESSNHPLLAPSPGGTPQPTGNLPVWAFRVVSAPASAASAASGGAR
jgi:Tfp pilus assembly protein PilN